MAFALEPYQQKISDDIDEAFLLGHNKVMVQAPTRSGKTVIFCNKVQKFLNKALSQNKYRDECLILVHDQKLLRQIKKTLYRDHMIVAEEITAKTKSLPQRGNLFEPNCNRVFVAMEKTFSNRIKIESFSSEIRRIGLIIADEAHLSNFKRIFTLPMFAEVPVIGFSATPVSANTKDHLYPTYFTYLVLGPTIQSLIEYNKIKPDRGVVGCITYVLSGNIDRSQLDLFQSQEQLDVQVGEELSGTRQIKNTVNAYITKAYGKKMLCFNASRDHSKLVTAAFLAAGIKAMHIDSTMEQGDESNPVQGTILYALKWFHNTQGAILCNCNMTATGFDEPSCEGVIINKLSKSLSWIKQAEARGGTPYYDTHTNLYKTHHIILDMCDNTIQGGHGEWHDFVDWSKLFYEPRWATPGVAPKKECKACGAINPASARICVVCEAEFDFQTATEDVVEKTMKLVSKDIDVAQTIEVFSSRHEYASMWDLIRQTAYLAKQRMPNALLEEEDFNELLEEAEGKLKEWRLLKKKNKLEVSYQSIREELQEQLKTHGFSCAFKDQADCLFVDKRI